MRAGGRFDETACPSRGASLAGAGRPAETTSALRRVADSAAPRASPRGTALSTEEAAPKWQKRSPVCLVGSCTIPRSRLLIRVFNLNEAYQLRCSSPRTLYRPLSRQSVESSGTIMRTCASQPRGRGSAARGGPRLDHCAAPAAWPGNHAVRAARRRDRRLVKHSRCGS